MRICLCSKDSQGMLIGSQNICKRTGMSHVIGQQKSIKFEKVYSQALVMCLSCVLFQVLSHILVNKLHSQNPKYR